MCTPSVPKYYIRLSRDFNKWLHMEQNEWIYTLKHVYIHPYVVVHLRWLERQLFGNGGSIYEVFLSDSNCLGSQILWSFCSFNCISYLSSLNLCLYEFSQITRFEIFWVRNIIFDRFFLLLVSRTFVYPVVFSILFSG